MLPSDSAWELRRLELDTMPTYAENGHATLHENGTANTTNVSQSCWYKTLLSIPAILSAWEKNYQSIKHERKPCDFFFLCRFVYHPVTRNERERTKHDFPAGQFLYPSSKKWGKTGHATILAFRQEPSTQPCSQGIFYPWERGWEETLIYHLYRILQEIMMVTEKYFHPL